MKLNDVGIKTFPTSWLTPGRQVVYVPTHAEGDIHHPDCEEGFVTSYKELSDGTKVAYCRYWSNINPNWLRTRSCSEATPIENLVLLDTHNQGEVDQYVRKFQEES